MTKQAKHTDTATLNSQRVWLQGVINARELGGYMNREGKKIKGGKILRTGQLYAATSEDKRILSEDYHVGTIIDFRSDFEAIPQPDPPVFGSRHYDLPVLEFKFTAREQQKLQQVNEERSQGKRLLLLAEAGMTADTGIYERIMFGEPAKKAYKRFFELLLENDSEHSVLFHCTQGKDRTGIAAAMLLTILDFSDELILSDYMLTNKANFDIIHEDISAVSVYTSDETIIDSVRRMNGVSEHLLEYAFSRARVEYGSVREYIKKTFDLSEDDIYELKHKYLG